MTHAVLRRPRTRTTLVALAAVATLAAAPAGRADAPLATVTPSGQATVCLDNQQSSVNPAAANAGDPSGILSTGILNLAGAQCTTSSSSTSGGSTGGSGGGGSASTGSSDQGGGGAGGGTDTSASTGTTTASMQSSTESSKQSSTTTSAQGRSAALSPPAAASITVTAANASGVAISAVRYRVLGNKRLGVSVLVRDRSRHLIRNAIVTLSGVIGAQQTLRIARSTYTNGHGQASFVLPLQTKVSGKRLLMRISARTPSARVFRLGSRIVPRASAA